MFPIDEVIAREEISVVFHDGNIPAGLPKDTQSMLLPEGSPGRLLEYLNFEPSDILALPLVEDGAEEIPPRFGRHSALAQAEILVVVRMIVVYL